MSFFAPARRLSRRTEFDDTTDQPLDQAPVSPTPPPPTRFPLRSVLRRAPREGTYPSPTFQPTYGNEPQGYNPANEDTSDNPLWTPETPEEQQALQDEQRASALAYANWFGMTGGGVGGGSVGGGKPGSSSFFDLGGGGVASSWREALRNQVMRDAQQAYDPMTDRDFLAAAQAQADAEIAAYPRPDANALDQEARDLAERRLAGRPRVWYNEEADRAMALGAYTQARTELLRSLRYMPEAQMREQFFQNALNNGALRSRFFNQFLVRQYGYDPTTGGFFGQVEPPPLPPGVYRGGIGGV